MKENGKKLLTNEQALFIIWNAILNQSQEPKKILENTVELMRRLNLTEKFEENFNRISYSSILESMVEKPKIHRFYLKMTEWIYESVYRLNENFDGNPREIFNGKSEEEIIGELKKFKGLGMHKIENICFVYNLYTGVKEDNLNRTKEIFLKCPKFLDTIDLEMNLIGAFEKYKEVGRQW